MSNAYVLVPILTLLLGGGIGYSVGRYQSRLLERLHLLERSTPIETSPAVTMGVYDSPRELNETAAPVGLVQANTPQRVEYETEQAIEKEGLGR